MITRIKLFSPNIERQHRVNESPEIILGKHGQQRIEGYTGPFVDLDTKEEFTINISGWAEVVVEVED